MCDGINDCPTVDEDYCSDESEDEDNSTNEIASKNECPCGSFTLCVFFSDGDCDSSCRNIVFHKPSAIRECQHCQPHFSSAIKSQLFQQSM